MASVLTPVALPPGCFRLATSPVLTGSPPVNTIGIDEVTALAAIAAEARFARDSFSILARGRPLLG